MDGATGLGESRVFLAIRWHGLLLRTDGDGELELGDALVYWNYYSARISGDARYSYDDLSENYESFIGASCTFGGEEELSEMCGRSSELSFHIHTARVWEICYNYEDLSMICEHFIGALFHVRL
jgi:hypothetical protein